MESKESTPAYPSVGRFADNMCYQQYSASLKCLESNSDKSKCQEQFDVYKECKKKEVLHKSVALTNP
ncbi:hypothetical protein VitviT2T_023273 [Vitis vinifera]|uniref:CHCH domain-containing protein n=1 Tax=Vitis vinifera TaxID=29760 RepID=A0ABY9DC98_VITVI|nr:hypothetical protein VitviT2T_023273 [Vitis vinifera]